jgi:hypothetical protein
MAFIGPLIGLGSSIVGGIIGSKAAKKAAAEQKAAAAAATARMDQATKDANDQSNEMYRRNYSNVSDQFKTDRGLLENQLQDNKNRESQTDQRMISGWNKASEIYSQDRDLLRTGAAGADAQFQKDRSGLETAATAGQGFLQPWQKAGTEALAEWQKGTTAGFDQSKVTMDPGFDFRLQQGAKALQGSAAARGGVLSGAAQKSLARYSQDYSSGEFDKAYGRQYDGYMDRLKQLAGISDSGRAAGGKMADIGQTGARDVANLGTNQANLQRGYAGDIASLGNDFANRERGYTQDSASNAYNFGNLQRGVSGDIADQGFNYSTSLAGYGERYSKNFSDNLFRGAENSNEYTLGGANAGAAGTMGAANAWSGAISGAGRAVGDYFSNRYNSQGASPSIPKSWAAETNSQDWSARSDVMNAGRGGLTIPGYPPTPIQNARKPIPAMIRNNPSIGAY